MELPISLDSFERMEFRPGRVELSSEELERLRRNIDLIRDLIVFVSGFANAKGLGGHTGGPYDIVPEVLIVDGFMRGDETIYPVCYDEAGHRALIQYILAVLDGKVAAEALLHYRESTAGLYGHPERKDDSGIYFSSGRLGHMWPFVNGVARAEEPRSVVVFGSDGSQQEGNDAEAARHAVAHNLNIKLIIDDNNCTIAGHPSDYLRGYEVARTLEGHGLSVDVGDGEDVPELFRRIDAALREPGPRAVINRRVMAPGIKNIENSPAGHEAIPVDAAISYLDRRGRAEASAVLREAVRIGTRTTFAGSSVELDSNRREFGAIVTDLLREMPEAERPDRVMVIDNDLEGSTGIKPVGEEFPELYIRGGIMERGNFSVAAGFGSAGGRQAVFSTYAAFLEMLVSEITMARLNDANILAHFSHAGIDQMADNTCHYGVNVFLADSAAPETGSATRLYYPADAGQLRAVVRRVFDEPGLRFVFSPRVSLPLILSEQGEPLHDESRGYVFRPGRDEIVRSGSAGYIVSYGEMLCRSLDAVETLRESGIDVGLINKPTLNAVDRDMLRVAGSTGFVLVVESQNVQSSLGARYGSCLLKQGLSPRYDHLGTVRSGSGGLAEHLPRQGLGREEIIAAVRRLV